MRLTRVQLAALDAIDRHGGAWAQPHGKTIKALEYRHKAIERVTLFTPHPTERLAIWRLTTRGATLLGDARERARRRGPS